MFWKASIAMLAVLVLWPAATAYAQVSTAAINGTVQDNTGAVVSGATVQATQTETNSKFAAITDDHGVYRLPSLPVGPYTLSVTAAGFATYRRENIVLTVGQIATVDVQLKVGAASESVTVTTEVPLVNQTDPTIASTIEEEAVGDLPLNGRNPAALVLTAVGVINAGENTGSGQLASLAEVRSAPNNSNGSIATAVNGIRAGGTYFSLDGASNVDPSFVGSGPFPDPDATQEFQVVTGTYGSRYMSAPGGAVNVVTRSGANQFHGALFEFLRNGYVNAENAILSQPDPLKRNQFGGTFGGPIAKDKSFFFFSYQGTRIASLTINKYPVPTAAERTGTFQAYPCAFDPVTQSCPHVGPLLSIPLNLVLAGALAYGLPPMFGPATISAVTGNFYNFLGGGSPLIPMANSTAAGNNFIIGVPNHLHENQYLGRIDYSLKQHRLFARYFTDHAYSPAVVEPTTPPYDVFDTSADNTLDYDLSAIGDSWSPNPKWVLESRLSFMNITNNSSSPTADSFATYPIMGATNYPVSTDRPGIAITVAGNMVPFGNFGIYKTPRTNLSATEDVINTTGKHQISFGVDLQRIHSGGQNESGQDGVAIYAGVFSNTILGHQILGLDIQDAPFADFYFGHPIVFIQGDGFFASNHGWLWGLYGEDQYRLSNRLTVTYGARWDPWIPYLDEGNEVSCFRKGRQSTVFTNAPTGLIYPGDQGCPAGGVGDYNKLVQPRVGLAYQLSKSKQATLHAGYGIYSIQVPLGAYTGFQAFPWTRQYEITNPFQEIDNIWGSNGYGLTNPFAGGFIGFGYKPASDVAYPTTPINAANFASNFRPGYAQQYSLSIEKSLGANNSVELAYVGSKGTRMAQNYDLNKPLPAANASTTNEASRRPYQGINFLSTEAPIGFSKYNSLQFTYHHRAAGGLDINSNFTWAKCIDDGSNPGNTGSSVEGNLDIDPDNPGFSNGLCDFDQQLNWRTTAVWNAPKLANAAPSVRWTLGAWVMSANLTLDGGQPFSITTGTSDNSFSGAEYDRADYVPGVPLHANGRLNYAAFTLNAPGTDGDTPRNGFRQDPNYQIDYDLMKDFPVTERFHVQFRAEAFNIINHPNYFGPFATWDTANAGDFDTYTAARDPRQLQFALKLSF